MNEKKISQPPRVASGLQQAGMNYLVVEIEYRKHEHCNTAINFCTSARLCFYRTRKQTTTWNILPAYYQPISIMALTLLPQCTLGKSKSIPMLN